MINRFPFFNLEMGMTVSIVREEHTAAELRL
jgi:hypothetical protein